MAVPLAQSLLTWHDRDELRARAGALRARLGKRVPNGLVVIHPAMLADERGDRRVLPARHVG